MFFFFFSSRRRHTRWPRDWSSDVCSSDLAGGDGGSRGRALDAIDTNGPADVLQFALTEIDEDDRHLVPYEVADGARNHDLARQGDLMDAGGDVDAIAN